MEGGSGHSPPNNKGRPLPSYTSIDLEHELSDIFSTNLNPHLRDPDMSAFYSTRMGRGEKKLPAKAPPPPLYPLPEELPPKPAHLPYRPGSLFSSRTAMSLFLLLFFAFPLILLLCFLFSDLLVRYRYAI